MGWTDERILFITTQFLVAEVSAKDIAAMLGDVSREAVCGKLYRLGVRRPQVRRPRQLRAPRPPKRTQASPSHAEKRPRSAFVRPLPPPELSGISSEIPLLATEPHHCRWIEGKMAGAFYVCGQQNSPGISFCDRHAAIAYLRSKSRSRKAE